MGQQRLSFLSLMSIENDIMEVLTVTCREGANGATPRWSKAGGTQRGKLQKFKFYN